MHQAEPAAFLSYVHSDDDHDKGRISALRQRLEGEVRMHTGKPFQIFQDRNDLSWGQNWSDRIDASLNDVTFLIPIVTPSFLNSPACRREYLTFQQREVSLGSNELILPIYYLSSDHIENGEDPDEIGISLRARQYSDWRDLRFYSLDSAEVARQLATQAAMIKERIKSLNSIFQSASRSDAKSHPISTENQVFRASQKISALDQRNIQSIIDALVEGSKEADDEMQRQASTSFAEELPAGDPSPYRIYTTEYDEIVEAGELLGGTGAIELVRVVTTLASEIAETSARSIARFTRELTAYKGKDSASAIILLDNSGSLRGRPISYLAAWSIVLTEIFERVGFQVQVLGFTTRSWRGGRSREKWLLDGRPAHPGRLCDLRYIRYKDFDQQIVSTVQNFSAMMREGILKENVDGEALLFAKSLLDLNESKKKLLLIFSDGAPVDDSTLATNSVNYLDVHLRKVIKELKSDRSIATLAVGIDHDVVRYYDDMGIPSKAEQLGQDLFRLMRKRVFIQEE